MLIKLCIYPEMKWINDDCGNLQDEKTGLLKPGVLFFIFCRSQAEINLKSFL